MNKTLRLALALSLSLGVRSAVAQSSLSDIQSEAIEMYQAGRYEAAIPLYRKIANAQPKNSGALKDLLVSLSLADHAPEAASVASRLVRLTPNDIEAHFMYARALLLTGKKEAAMAEIQRCRELDPNEQHIQLAEARVEGMLHEYDAALAHMEAIKKAHPEYHEVYAELARVQGMTGQYAKAAQNWALAVKFFPANRGYQYREAEALYLSGAHEAGLKKMEPLVTTEPVYGPALDFMTDAALVRGDLEAAHQLLESNLTKLRSDDESRLLRLARIDQRRAKWDHVITTADRWLLLNPQSGFARMLKADALRKQGHNRDAIAIYLEVLRANPAAGDAWVGIAQAEQADLRPEKALDAIQRAEALDPTNPYLLISHSYYLYEMGNTQESTELLKNWVAAHPESAVPVVLYHGLSPYPKDPLLAYSLHRSTEAFDDDMKQVAAAHFTPITTDQLNAWLEKKTPLPERAILIAFDDGRFDSLQYGDPILKKYGLKATMFVAVSNADDYATKTASWKELKHYHATGRWDIQSHGDEAHDHIAVDGQGRRGLFLINKKWLEESNRLEADDEWQQRILKDHQNGQAKIRQHLGHTPHTFSFPEGNFGQQDIPNAPDAAEKTLRWTQETFTSAFHQDEYGFNHQGRDPMRLTRYEPTPNQKGTALVHHYTDLSPAILMERRLLRTAAWENHIDDAYARLADLKKRGLSTSALSAEEARIRLAMGDWEGARHLAEMALREDDSEENRELWEEIDSYKRHYWKGSFAYQSDNQHRISREFRQDLGMWRAPGGVDVSLHQFTGSYSERGAETVTDNGGGVGIAKDLNRANRLSLETSGHFLTGQADNTYSIEGRLHTTWPEHVSTDLSGGRDLYYYGRALNANVSTRYINGLAQWQILNWRASGRTRLEDISDDNKRISGMIEGGYRVFLPKLWLVARGTWDTTKHVSPNYYSPQVLQEYQFGADYTLDITKKTNLNVVYLPGVGKEKTSDAVFIHSVDATLNVALTSALTFSPYVAFLRQPTYHRDTYGATLTYRF